MRRLLFITLLMTLAACAPTTGGTVPIPTRATREVTAVSTSTPIPVTVETSTEQPAPMPSATPSAYPEPQPTPTAIQALQPLCPDIPRPAIVSHQNSGGLRIWNPLTSETCTVITAPLDATVDKAVGDSIYLSKWEESTDVFYGLDILRYNKDGRIDYFSLPGQTVWGFLPSESGEWIAWTNMAMDAETEVVTNTLFVTNLSTNETTELVSVNNQKEVNEGSPYISWILYPIRFVDDTLLYSIEPNGKGGSWEAYTGQYRTLFRIPLSGGDPELIYHCPPADETSSCLGDISANNEWIAVTNREANEISVLDFEGNVLRTFSGPGEDFIGHPWFDENGRILFHSATTGPDGLSIEQAYVSLIDPFSGEEAITLQEGDFTYLQGWYDSEHYLVWSPTEPVRLGDLEGNSILFPEDIGRTSWILDE